MILWVVFVHNIRWIIIYIKLDRRVIILKKMSLKSRIIAIMLIGITAFAVISGGGTIYFLRKIVVNSYREKATGILNSVKNGINISKFREIVNKKDSNLEYYKELSRYLGSVKKDVGAKYLYTAEISKSENKDEIIYIADAYNPIDTSGFSEIGTVDTDDNSEKIKEGKVFATNIRYQDEWGWLLSAYAPIIDENGNMIGYIGVDFSAEKIVDEINSIAVKFIIAAIIIAVLISLFMLKKLNKYFKPLNEISEKSIELSKRNLTIRFDDSRKDEIGKMSSNLNGFLDVLTEIIKEIKEYSEVVAGDSEELSVTMNQISSSVDTLGSSSNGTATAIEEMSANSEVISKNIEELLMSSEETLSLANSGGDAVKATINGIRNIKRAVDDGTREVKTLGNRTSEIGEIVNVINDIAAQTNLLALNAAIEAARAGDAGKGFEVVAEEVRKLAEKTTVSTKEIAKTVKEIQAETSVVISKMAEVKSEVENGVIMAGNSEITFKNIISKNERLKEMVNEILNSIKEQNIATEEIADQTEKIAGSVEENGRAMEQSSVVISAISEIAERLNEIVKMFKV